MRTKKAPFQVPLTMFSQEVWMKATSYDVFWAIVKASGNTGTSLGAKVGCSRQLIAYIANGKRTCTPTLAAKIAAAVGVPTTVLFTEHQTRKPVRTTSPVRRQEAA